MPSSAEIIDHCQQWVLQVIVGLNFCPFAKSVVVNDSVCYQVVNEREMAACLMALSDEMKRLITNDTVETTLMIFPIGFESFEGYLDLVDIANALLIDEGHEGTFQLASFHPDYCFDGQPYDDAANYTNRSPYPILHIIREESLEKALASVLNPEDIPNRNIELAREKGLVKMQALLHSCLQST
jgi:hypothetical protein